jgi:hypothetical protein
LNPLSNLCVSMHARWGILLGEGHEAGVCTVDRCDAIVRIDTSFGHRCVSPLGDKPKATTPVSLANLMHQTDASGKSVHTAQPVSVPQRDLLSHTLGRGGKGRGE